MNTWSLLAPLGISLRYLRFRFRSGNAHGLHSPFVFELYTQVIRQQMPYYVFPLIEQIRDLMLFSDRRIQVLDLGAGSHTTRSPERLIKDIARISEKPPHFGELLFRLVHRFKPATVFDLGTSLGITTLYMASAHTKANVFTFEGCPQTAAVARENFAHLSVSNIELIEGNLDQTLARQAAEVQAIDFAFFDANHRLEPTLRYFETCLPKATPDSVFVFDDIYWSAEMSQAWRTIQAHPAVALSIDLFGVGMVFFRQKQPKQHFRLRWP